jgi:hypothetical protein
VYFNSLISFSRVLHFSLRSACATILDLPSYLGFHPNLVQDCVATRTSLEGKLARLLVRNHELEDELASWRLHGEPDPSLLATLGASDVLLSLLLAGGVAWRQYYGPDGPVYPVDR